MVRITKLGTNRIDCAYSLIPAIEYLTERYSCHSFDISSVNEFVFLNGYTYFFRLYPMTAFFTRWIGEYANIKYRKRFVILDSGVLHRQNESLFITFPIQNRTVIPLGTFELERYTNRRLEYNHCIYCDEYHNRMKQHLKGKKHKKRIHSLIYDVLIKDLNDDIVDYICSYL